MPEPLSSSILLSSETQPGVAPVLAALAAVDLPVNRPQRFDGSGFEVQLSRFSPADRDILWQLYTAVKELYEVWQAERSATTVPATLERLGKSDFFRLVQQFGRANAQHDLARIVHDIRGGGLTYLIGAAGLMAQLGFQADLLEACGKAARDHAKLMRNLIVDIDPERRAADEELRIHGIDDMVRKWNGAQLVANGRPVRIVAHSTFTGSISARCLETSSIDRLTFNYLNNAIRFTADGLVRLTIFPVSSGLVRFVVDNGVTAEQERWLTERTGGDLRFLFQGGLTRGGEGIGLSNCADLIAASFGVTAATALADGYLGARILDRRYYAWFHWPALLEEPAAALACTCQS